MNRDAFIRAIVEEPADLSLRLVFADWLEEQGQTQEAGFVRMEGDWHYQYRPAENAWKASPPLGRHGAVDLLRCAQIGREIIESHFILHDPKGFVVIRHGFIEQAWCMLDLWRNYGPKIVASQPIMNLVLTDRVFGDNGIAWIMWARAQAGLPEPKNRFGGLRSLIPTGSIR